MTPISVYSIYDSKAKAYMQPFFCQQNAVAFRSCEQAARNPKSPFAEFPADFTLFRVAEWDDEAGKIVPLSANENLGNFIQFLPAPSDKVAA